MKNNKKAVVIIGILLVLVVASGCEGGKIFGKKQDKRPITDADIRKGTDGLDMEFLKNAPPERVFEGRFLTNATPERVVEGSQDDEGKVITSDFPISLRLKNEGASNIEEGILIFASEKAYVNVSLESKERQEFIIKGKSIYSPVGDEEFVTLTAGAKRISAQSETHPSTIFATACYPYNTILGTSVCIDTDIIGEVRGKKVCDIKDLTFSEGQGAPVAVTKIETRMLPDVDVNKVKPHFIIFIENKGNGEVVNSDKLGAACSSSGLEYTDFNTLTISASLPQGDLKCSEKTDEAVSTEVRLREKEDMVRCTLEDGIDIGRDAYTAPLKIELNYGYTFTISKDIIIEKVLKY